MRFDFEAAATRLGMRMTIDGSGDELIRMQGVEQYFFCDDDGGESDCESEVGDDGEQIDGSLLEPREDAQEEMRDACGHEKERMGTQLIGAQFVDERLTRTEGRVTQHTWGLDLMVVENDCNTPFNADEEVAESSISGHGVTSCLPAAVAPPGYIMVEACPPLETKRQKLSLVGKLILYGWEDDDRTGWFVGRVAHNRVTARDKRGVPTANYIVRYTAKQTNGQIDGLVACELSARTYGDSQWWVLLQRSGAGLCRRSALGRSNSSDGEQLALL